MNDKLQAIIDRYRAVEFELNDPTLAHDAKRLRDVTREYKSLGPVADAAETYLRLEQELADNRALIEDPSTDPAFRDMVYEDVRDVQSRLEELDGRLRVLLIPKDPQDVKNCIMEIRAGTGGEEAALFAGDLFRMYQRYCERKSWRLDVIDFTESERGGYKEITFEVEGDEVFGTLKYESGVHRVQRVPETESQGRVHTSAATVAVLPEAEEVDVEINPGDLRIDIFRSGGKGGQNVNKVETAVRIVHLPTNIVVQCQDERSQLKNREKAMKVLRSRLYEMELERQHAEIAGARKSMVKSGDRSEKIRTYNWPQNRVTDHRLEGDGKNHPLQHVVDGDIDPIIEALRMADHADTLSEGNG
ncbi:MAG: peptide chain release factor 1 [Candidatus Kapabacteria bacterium]|jgi:peptide chain release factor 1|nr:peptide chain release factor 1 [Candidatus Kapabacteria bacterium]